MRKRVKKNLKTFYHSLSFKLFLILLSIMLLIFAIYSTLFSSLQKKILEETVALSAFRVGDVVKSSLYRFMLKNEREELSSTVLLIGNEPGIESVRVFNKKGQIKFSSKKEDINQVVDKNFEACFVCHSSDKPFQSLPPEEKRRIYTTPDGSRIMELVNPIRNAPECSDELCHAHDSQETILGVLDVQMSLNELDQAVSKTQLTTVTLSLGLTFFALILFALVTYFFIHRPVSTLQMGTVRLAVGDLEHRIDMKRNDELGMLARSFNNMAENLKTAYDELKEWSRNLEKRVLDKTEELERFHRGLLQIEKMASLGKLAATVAHELNNPLAGIVTYAKLLQRKVIKNMDGFTDKEKILQELELIRSESIRCGNIVSNLLMFARESKMQYKEHLLKEIINRALSIVSHHIKLSSIKTEIRINIKPEQITCDSDQLTQALIALYINSVEAMPNGGYLKVSAYNDLDEPDKIIIQISDDGVGIPDGYKSKIFEPFFSTKKDQKGVGLGLSVVYGIVQHHKGKIWVESNIGEGTTFFIKLPIYQSNPERNEVPS